MRQRGALGWFKHDITHRGVTAWVLFVLLASFYLFLYFPDKLGELGTIFELAPSTVASLRSWGERLDFFSDFAFALGLSSKWTLYGLLYTIAIVGGGVYVLRKYRHNRYQVIRIIAIMVVQVFLAFSLPLLMADAGTYSYYFSYLWPLKIDYFYPSNLSAMPLLLILYSILGAVLMVPILGIFFGKRWYCAWVCGCGGLANTAGDPFRHLSNKSQRAWNFEKFSIHSMLGIAILTTALVVIGHFAGDQAPQISAASVVLKFLYGVVVTAFLSGLIGVALYPLKGTRVWCRYYCPMAALLGLVQKFGRYRITVKENMCISCGLCSKYCEMGIDVRAYAQKNQSFVRASCVGCGLCAEVCPRGVLKLENRWDPDPQELSMDALLSESYKYEPERKAI